MFNCLPNSFIWFRAGAGNLLGEGTLGPWVPSGSCAATLRSNTDV